mmetsp:Transcript_12347/g.27362  ORF Transcript_12347/g.27362 Transcript_12347/m.27362 type:complete len:208 (-) Transcript_12347:1198-1821(-)
MFGAAGICASAFGVSLGAASCFGSSRLRQLESRSRQLCSAFFCSFSASAFSFSFSFCSFCCCSLELKKRGGPEAGFGAGAASGFPPNRQLSEPAPAAGFGVAFSADGVAGWPFMEFSRPRPKAAHGSSLSGSLFTGFSEKDAAFSRRFPRAAHSAFSLSVALKVVDSILCLPFSQGGVAALSLRCTTVAASASSFARSSFSCVDSRR